MDGAFRWTETQQIVDPVNESASKHDGPTVAIWRIIHIMNMAICESGGLCVEVEKIAA